MWNNINPYGRLPVNSRGADETPPAADPHPQGTAGGTPPLRDDPGAAPYPEDEVLTEWFCDWATVGRTRQQVASDYGWALRRFSGFLSLNGLPALSAPGRLQEPDRLRRDAHVFIERFHESGRQKNLIPALNRLTELAASGEDSITIRGSQRPRLKVPDADGALIKGAFPGLPAGPGRDIYSVNLRNAGRSLSAWLHENGRPGLSDTAYLFSEQAGADAGAFSRAHPANAGRVNMILAHLRAHARGEVPHVGRLQNTRTIPLADQRLALAYLGIAKDLARQAGTVYKKNSNGHDSIDKKASQLRSFSAWRTARGLPALTDHLHDPGLQMDMDMYTEDKYQRSQTNGRSAGSSTARSARSRLSSALKTLQTRFPPGTPVTVPEAPAESFGLPGSDWSGWDMSLFVPGADGGPAPADSDSVFGGLAPLDSRERFSSDGLSGALAPGLPETGEVNRPVPEAPAESFALPGSDWSGWGMSLSLGGHGPADSDSVFGGLAPLDSRERFSSDGLSGTPASGLPETGEVNRPGPDGAPFVSMRDAVPPFRPDGVGFASGEGLSCLLDSILQCYHNIRRGHGAPRGLTDWLDGEVRRVREALSAQGVDLVPARGEIDIYGGPGSYFAGAMGLRLQVIQAEFQEEPDGTYVRYTAHPEIGEAGGRAVRLLHTPGHFQPLWG
uniref:HsvG virulence protein n=1 Tax=Pantoea agglomerans pv. gypsophilae TaxID=48984 RepID=A2I8A1_PANAY|nr:HsvG virulence protein [Pantoea agglomerans pv. gypsophilae]